LGVAHGVIGDYGGWAASWPETARAVLGRPEGAPAVSATATPHDWSDAIEDSNRAWIDINMESGSFEA